MTIVENRYLTGNFAPVHEEVTAVDLPVTGTIPESLRGRFLRNGPNPVSAVDPATYHWFGGDGMVHGVRLADGAADWYRNRWVRAGGVIDALGVPDPGGEIHSGMDFAANTNVIGHAGKTLAIVEAGGRPIELSYELDTLRRGDFDGTLPNGFTAHPKRDPETGELHAVCLLVGARQPGAVHRRRHRRQGHQGRADRDDRRADASRHGLVRALRARARPSVRLRPRARDRRVGSRTSGMSRIRLVSVCCRAMVATTT